MEPDDHLLRYLKHCLAVHQRLVRQGRWPWPDSRNPEDMLESEDTNETE